MYRIRSKEDSYRLYQAGAFGNKLRTWDDLDTLLSDDYCGDVSMRYASGYGKWFGYSISQKDIRAELSRWLSEGADLGFVRFNETPPDDHLVFQGEIMTDIEYKYILSYSTDKVSLRAAMEYPTEALGDAAMRLIYQHLSKASIQNVKRLMGMYQHAVIEFSTYDHHLGDIPGNNTVFWEVRNY